MTIPDLLREHREHILGGWKERVFATYHSEATAFLASEVDRFANPVGHATALGLEATYDALASGQGARALGKELDGIIRVRAVQDFRPSQAVGFVLLLRDAAHSLPMQLDAELAVNLDRLVEELLLAAFDAYTKCRDDMQAIRARDLKRRTYQLVEMAQRITPLPSDGEETRR